MENNVSKKITKEQIVNFPEKWFTDKMVDITRKAVNSYRLKLNENGRAEDCEADAFRHTYMQCWLAYTFGEKIAKYLGDKHEHGKDPNTNISTNMDLWNNQIGRELAKEIKNKYGSSINLADPDLFECIAIPEVIDKVRSGEVITDPKNDKRKFENMERERLKDSDRIFYEDEYWDDMDDDERKRYSTHYTNYKNKIQNKFPTKAELQMKVLKGDLIYIKDYTRSDGVKVRGYYRRRVTY